MTRLGLCFVCLGVLVYVSGVVEGSSTQDTITVDTFTGGYKGIVVAISESLQQTNCSDYVDAIKVMFNEASSLLFDATGDRLYFSSVTIVIPTTWTCYDNSQNKMDDRWETAHLRVGPSHVLFGDAPWTQQPGGCGDPGDFIYMADNFITSDVSPLGNRGQLLLHEWSKFRWGVFEEYGHPGDPVYPPLYTHNSTHLLPNYCTDDILSGECSCNDGCIPGGNQEDCTFTPDIISPDNNITSSIMAAPFLDTVVRFCNISNHNSEAATKHNLLCDQQSVWSIINKHQDLDRVGGGSLPEVTFKTVQASGPRLTTVFIVDYTYKMREVRSRWEFLRDALRLFIQIEAPSTSSVGIVLMNGTNVVPSLMYTLDTNDNRNKLSNLIPDVLPKESTPKNLQAGIEQGAQMLAGVSGTMVLLTENMAEYDSSGQNLVEAAGGTPVSVILYPNDPGVSLQVYQDLVNSATTTDLLIIDDKQDFNNQNIYQSVENYATLCSNLRHVFDKTIVEIDSATANQAISHLSLSVQNSSAYEAGAIIEVLHSIVGIPYTTVSVTGPGLPKEYKEGSGTIFSYSALQNGIYLVNVTDNDGEFSVFARVLGREVVVPGMTVDVWAPRGLEQLTMAPGIPPIILATVTTADGRIVFDANVTATVQTSGNDGNDSTMVQLRDGGAAGDVTGSDGIYTGVLVTFDLGVMVDVSVTATDNEEKAWCAGAQQKYSSSPRAPFPSGTGQSCCGSVLDLSVLQPEILPSFTVASAPGLRGKVTGKALGSLHPGRITDLRAHRDGWTVTLKFTSPGAMMDTIKADYYEISYRTPGEEASNETIPALDVGKEVSHDIRLPGCDKVYTFSVVAVDSNSLKGKTSNMVREIVSCSYHEPKKLSGGQIAGIVIGCILGVLLILLIIFLCLNRDHLEDLVVWRVLTCRYCCKRTKDDDRLYNTPPPKTITNKRNDIIRPPIRTLAPSSQPVRSVDDLYSRPNLESKQANRLKREEQNQRQADDSDDGGFGERKRMNNVVLRPSVPPRQTSNNLNNKTREDDFSSRSSINSDSTQTTAPINQVGLPTSKPPGSHNHGHQPSMIYGNYGHQPNVVHDNHAYDGSEENYGYNANSSNFSNIPDSKRNMRLPYMRQAPPRPPRNNTQV